MMTGPQAALNLLCVLFVAAVLAWFLSALWTGEIVVRGLW